MKFIAIIALLGSSEALRITQLSAGDPAASVNNMNYAYAFKPPAPAPDLRKC